MSPRSIRRAAEHKARKLAAKQSRLEAAAAPLSNVETGTHRAAELAQPATQTSAGVSPVSPSPKWPSRNIGLTWQPAFDEPQPLSPARLAANRANAELSTGPRTCEGKSKVRLNAVKTGLTGRTVLLASDDAAAYVQHIENYRAEHQPTGLRETELVQSLADTAWRLRRIPGLEMAIYAQGRCEFADSFEHHDSSLRPAMIELQTHLKYEKQLRNLQLQESRLARRYEKEMAELRNLQKEREDRETEANKSAEKPAPEPQFHHAAAAHTAAPHYTPEIGFEFSTESAASHPAASHALQLLSEAA